MDPMIDLLPLPPTIIVPEASPRRVGGDRVVTLNIGLGQDSMTMLGLLEAGELVAEGLPVRIEDVTSAVTSDTGHEWEHSYRNVSRVEAACLRMGIPFYMLRKPREEGPEGWNAWVDAYQAAKAEGVPLEARPAPFWREGARAWSIAERADRGYYHLRPPILEDYGSRATVVSLSKGDCTENHKLAPIRKLIGDLSLELYGLDNRAWGALVRKGVRRPHLTLVGYTADERRRLADSEKRSPDYVTEAYPLMEAGIGKADEFEQLARWGWEDTLKSGCRMCCYQPVGWYWALSVTDPVYFDRVCDDYEGKALEANPKMFVAGKKRLRDQVTEWRRRNPDATIVSIMSKSYVRCDGRRIIEESSLEV